MTKRMTLLMVAIFSWLFVGSLIIFHQEHVLGKHVNAISHHYIVPKSKEKSAYQVKDLDGFQKTNPFIGDYTFTEDCHQGPNPGIIRKLAVSHAGIFSDHPPRVIHGLRAPPMA